MVPKCITRSSKLNTNPVTRTISICFTHCIKYIYLLALQKSNVTIGTEQIRGQRNMNPITSLATPRKAKATEVQKEKALLVAAPCQAKRAKAEVKARTTPRANPKVCILYIVFDSSFGIRDCLITIFLSQGKITDQRNMRLIFLASQAVLVWEVDSLKLINVLTTSSMCISSAERRRRECASRLGWPFFRALEP